jgi:hypothetical protein
MTARTSSPVSLSSNTLETIFAKSIDPDGLLITIMGLPTTTLASSITCCNFSADIARASV